MRGLQRRELGSSKQFLIVVILVCLWGSVSPQAIAGNVAENKKCEQDSAHSLQQLIESKTIGSTLVPKDIKFKNVRGTYKSINPTEAFYWPKKEYSLYGISCRWGCGYKIRVVCKIEDSDGTSWLVFHDNVDGTLTYVNAADFILDKK